MTRQATTLLLLALAACGDPAADRERVLLVTTTSVESSGLLDQILERYHADQDRFRLATTAVGSGAALEIGRRGDADVLLTHDPVGEAWFMAEGHGTEQGLIMRNDFIIAGPPADPAGVRGMTDVDEALRRIAAGGRFVSRGDDSGTHRRELRLWDEAGLDPRRTRPDWYIEAGTGMGETLQMADQLQAYLLTDRSTFRYLESMIDLEPLVQGVPPLENPYSYTLPASPLNPEGARDFVDWLRGPGQDLIRRYGVERFGDPLFDPAG